MTSVQRIVEYTKLDQEDDLEKKNDGSLALQDWP
eukprot:CAMPEP_0176404270 /NCGR_PEP_ID=MMETSP0126-20121128/50733_1 /TAXON_ID=141414 ORGANISM="Strombidinopsis acuminatum, Strain SPMC142" /NCGR_SAMPLE_ID=MMETSP0126 /ASSEMBLY_ACC=CAM_ASM_000229 /LENGTH=33 /DNA_ID= /DNA_START= /DNA_END= /DNA_ORIENTATION=